MSDALKPCPFCGGTSITTYTRRDGDDEYTECQCGDCNAVGPDNCEGLNWNTRAALAAGEARPVAKLHSDGYWTHEPGRDPFAPEGPNKGRASLAVFAAPPQPAIPEGYMLVPAWKGYALLGTGQYAINHSAPPADPELGAELFITIATEAEKSGGRQVGEARDNPPDAPPVQPEDMVIRIGFLSERAVFALEDQLRMLREAHGWHPPQPAEPSEEQVDAANAALYEVLFGPSGPDVDETALELRRRAMRAALVAAQGAKR